MKYLDSATWPECLTSLVLSPKWCFVGLSLWKGLSPGNLLHTELAQHYNYFCNGKYSRTKLQNLFIVRLISWSWFPPLPNGSELPSGKCACPPSQRHWIDIRTRQCRSYLKIWFCPVLFKYEDCWIMLPVKFSELPNLPPTSFLFSMARWVFFRTIVNWAIGETDPLIIYSI